MKLITILGITGLLYCSYRAAIINEKTSRLQIILITIGYCASVIMLVICGCNWIFNLQYGFGR